MEVTQPLALLPAFPRLASKQVDVYFMRIDLRALLRLAKPLQQSFARYFRQGTYP
jgi:hypothetical protein